jgi:DNA-binding NarL/FixJ family response regulator
MEDEMSCFQFIDLIESNFKDCIDIVCTVRSLKHLEVLCALDRPDLVIMHGDFKDGYGYSTIQRLLSFKSDMKIIAVGDIFLKDVAERLSACGACGYFTHNDNRSIVIDLVERILKT